MPAESQKGRRLDIYLSFPVDIGLDITQFPPQQASLSPALFQASG
jgi:hypothetical protein